MIYQYPLFKVSVPTYPATIPANKEFKPSYLFLIQRKAHFTTLNANVEELKNRIMDRYSGVNDFLMPAIPLERDLNDFISWRIELMIRPYLICFRDCLMASIIQEFGCLQYTVFAFITSIIKILCVN